MFLRGLVEENSSKHLINGSSGTVHIIIQKKW